MRAKPVIRCGLLAGALALPVSALALGLGKLTVESGLGQPLTARIELTAAQKDELDSLRAKIADPSVYRDNNVQYPGVAGRTRISVEHGPNNTAYLKVLTTQAVNEPYLDLLVEVNWATGRVLRNYTFLLDPPGVGQAQAQAVEPAPPVRAEAAPPRGARAARRGAEPTAAARSTEGGDTYTVKRGDTLSKIAREYKPENVSVEQMLVALFRSNESAFIDKNMNRMRSGQILTIPAADQASEVAQPDAVKVVRVQAADWRTYRDRVAAAAPESEATGARQAATGKITAAIEDKGAATQAGKDQLKVSREAQKAGTPGTAATAQAEDATAKDKALREANSRVAALEKTLSDLQKATELKSQTIAELQRQADAAKGAKPAESAKAETAKTEPAKIAAGPVAAAPETKAPETKAPEPTAAAPAATETKAETKAPETAAAPPATPAPTTPPKAAAPKTPPKIAQPRPEPSFFDDLLANTPSWAIGVGSLAVLGGIAAIVAARRRRTTKFEDSIISGTDIKTNTVFGSTGGGVVNTGDNSLASDFSREGLGNIDTDEVDPIAEAEVYLAYGRDAQAEEILKDALKKDPQRQEIYLKLLEIHAQHNKPSAFETVATELYAVSGGQGEVWQKAMALGRQLDPSNPLFAEAGGAAAFAAAAATAPAAEQASPADAQVFSVPPELKPEAKPAATAERSLDFTLDEDISLSPTSGVAAQGKTPAAILAGAAEEVAKSTRPAPAPVSAIGEGAAASGAAALVRSSAEKSAAAAAQSREISPLEPESVPKFDLDFNLDEPTRPSAAPKPAAPTPMPAAPAPEPALAAATAGAPAPQLTRPSAAIELDKLDLVFDAQRSTFEDPTPSVLDGQWHDAATKLDLARAYQEMGDVEGAREILQEVLHEGDDQQKTEAQTLLSKLA